jgi:hypothetical protein
MASLVDEGALVMLLLLVGRFRNIIGALVGEILRWDDRNGCTEGTDSEPFFRPIVGEKLGWYDGAGCMGVLTSTGEMLGLDDAIGCGRAPFKSFFCFMVSEILGLDDETGCVGLAPIVPFRSAIVGGLVGWEDGLTCSEEFRCL